MVGYKLVGTVEEEGYKIYKQGLSIVKVLFSLEDFDHLVDLLDVRYSVREKGSFVFFKFPNCTIDKYYVVRRKVSLEELFNSYSLTNVTEDLVDRYLLDEEKFYVIRNNNEHCLELHFTSNDELEKFKNNCKEDLSNLPIQVYINKQEKVSL